ncbi:MAG: hypothetical protein LBJ58_04535 [Tannerellaceae bacterium]|nr:hypothetical protein [Tannerellaceae bacterium]
MKTKCLLPIAVSLMIGVFAACDTDGDGGADGAGGSGYAPKSIDGKEINFTRNGEWNFSSITRGSSTSVSINAEVISIAYDRDDPVCSWQKMNDNTALYTLEFWHKGYVPYTQSYAYGYNYYSLTLTFTSASAGTYTGTRNNGSASEKREGTFSIK